ncbi:MAG: phosphate ABC transporter permease PstA [Reyranella sp.]|uniref:phosphate ABC transporter permease PstA n=1 Tax=Reyranella sp. TaxID=1929291 RepID=UPI002730862F|nr:phosphate ABC transporter permease PstA [Reyranella sp.]MDP1963738.1 phosphate ABC transporter permease PstA [Reyranella sp.]MDP2372184.1 phosphate ABC transporter permease PstA [Reyranella sp.]
MTAVNIDTAAPAAKAKSSVYRRAHASDLSAVGEPFQWVLGGALALGCILIAGLLLLVFWNGLVTFWPKPIEVVRLTDGAMVAGEPFRSESFRVTADQLAKVPADKRAAIAANDGFADRTLYRIGNYDIYNDDFRWVPDYDVASVERPADMVYVERLEWGPLIGRIKSAVVNGAAVPADRLSPAGLAAAHDAARARWAQIRHIERDLIGDINHTIEKGRLRVRSAELSSGADSPAYKAAQQRFTEANVKLQEQFQALTKQAQALRAEDAKDTVTFAEIGGKEKSVPLSAVVRFFRPNELSVFGKLGIYLSRWWEFLSTEPREANTEGGILPAIFGTVAMTLLLVVFVAPFGVITALYLREYAKQGRLVAVVRISVNNLAGVPSIVYGVFGLGFFAYIVGGSIDQVFFPERLPSPTFGTGGLFWAALTLALLTVPVVIVATEEALAAVPRSMREGSLACGASKWQTIRRIVLPRAMPGIMTGIILAMARGAGEVAPLMLVGVVKLAPELPIDGYFPFIHLERSFMHLGFHIYDVGFQSRNSEAGKPMVFVTTLLLILLIVVMNATAIYFRNRLRRRFAGSQF